MLNLHRLVSPPIPSLKKLNAKTVLLGLTALLFALPSVRTWAEEAATWKQCGWGGGGFFYSTVYHPTKDGVIYMGGDVNGVYRTDDHGLNWKVINSGLADYGVFSLAVDKTHPDTVYAATEAGLCKSTDEGEHWQLLPLTGPKDLHITGEKGRSVRCVAVDPTNGDVVFASSPAGKVYKSSDGGQTWTMVYTPTVEAPMPDVARVQFGKVTDAPWGGLWFQMKFPEGAKAEECTGFGFNFQGDKSQPKTCYVLLQVKGGGTYRSKNLNDIFANDQAQTVILNSADFAIDPDYAAKNADKVATLPATPDWANVGRLDLACSGALAQEAYVGRFSKFFFVTNHAPEGKAGAVPEQTLLTAKDLLVDKDIQTYANIHIGDKVAGPIFSVAVAAKDPSLVLAATSDVGLVLSQDGGTSWHELSTPKRAAQAMFDPSDSNTIYGAFFTDGVWKSTDKGRTWTSISEGIPKEFAVREVAVSYANPLDVYAIGAQNYWSGGFYASHDGGKTWKRSSSVLADLQYDPTRDNVSGSAAPLSAPTNISISPTNPQELYISANWRSCLSPDAGATWYERDRGADISCITDIRFSGNRTYVTAMDEGTFMSENNGDSWRQLSPSKFTTSLSGHNWRIGITPVKGVDHIISTVSPWDGKYPPKVIVSDNGGESFNVVTAGLPDYITHANTMWGNGHPRALAIDPKDPNVVYLGLDGDATPGKIGGGIFKSIDGGTTWNQMPHQPACRRVSNGLQVDPTDSKRIFWGACGSGGGLYRTEDGGETWTNVFPHAQWIFNLLVTADGTIYCPEKNLWRSTDHGKTWKQLTHFTGTQAIMGLEVDPRDPKTVWFSQVVWWGGAVGAVYKTTDGGENWQDITGNLPHVDPEVLRFNPATNELWAGWVGLYKIKQ